MSSTPSSFDPPPPRREPLSFAELRDRAIRVEADARRLVAEAQEAARLTRAIIDACRRSGLRFSPDPPPDRPETKRAGGCGE